LSDREYAIFGIGSTDQSIKIDQGFKNLYGLKNYVNQLRGNYSVNVNQVKLFDAPIAQGIFKHMSYTMERRQTFGEKLGANGSGFSDEDLISNYLGFLEGYHNVTRTAIDNAADIIDDVEINLCLFKKIGKLGRNLEWQVPTDYNRVLEEVLYERRGYLEIIPSMVFPFELRRPWIDGAIDGRTRPPYIWLFLGAP